MNTAGYPLVFLSGLSKSPDLSSLLATVQFKATVDTRILGAAAKPVVKKLNERDHRGAPGGVVGSWCSSYSNECAFADAKQTMAAASTLNARRRAAAARCYDSRC
jgi:hypothetical protein